MQRLALERMDICFIHDIDVFTRGKDQPEVFRQAMDGCWKALERLRTEKVVTAIGVGVNECEVCHEALKQRDFDAFLLAGRYSLLEHEALNDFLPLCEKRGAAVLVGDRLRAVFSVQSKRLTGDRSRGIAVLSVEARNQRNEVVQAGKTTLMLRL